MIDLELNKELNRIEDKNLNGGYVDTRQIHYKAGFDAAIREVCELLEKETMIIGAGLIRKRFGNK